MEPANQTSQSSSPDALADRIFHSVLATMDLFSIYLGDRLGYYRSLSQQGSATSAELADRTGTAERYAREWLEQQAVTGFLSVTESTSDSLRRRYELPPGYDAVLADPDSPMAMAAMTQIIAGTVKPLAQLLDA